MTDGRGMALQVADAETGVRRQRHGRPGVGARVGHAMLDDRVGSLKKPAESPQSLRSSQHRPRGIRYMAVARHSHQRVNDHPLPP